MNNTVETNSETLEPRSGFSITARHLWWALIMPLVGVALMAIFNWLYPDLEFGQRPFFFIYVPLEIARIVICAGIFIVWWIPRKFTKDLQGLIISATFLALAILATFRLMTNLNNPMITNAETSNEALSLRVIARWTIVLSMLFVSYLHPGRKVKETTSKVVVAASGLFAVLAGLFVVTLWNRFPLFNVHGTGSIEFANILDYMAMASFFYVAYRNGRLSIERKDPFLFILAIAMSIAILTEFSFTLVNTENDLLKLIGNILANGSYVLIFFAVVRKSLINPYEQLSNKEKRLQSANARLQATTAELTASNAELKAFSYSVAHDLRNPLHSIMGCSEVLALDCGTKLDDDGKRALESIGRSAERMSQVIDDLLALSKITQRELHREAVDLSEIVRKFCEELKTSAPHRAVEFAIQPGLIANADAGLMRIIFENLIRNAWKFTSTQAHTRIEFGSTNENGSTTYFVRDNGVGFDMMYADRLFKPFVRLHSDSEFKGTGIGLATVKRIVDKHGGEVWAEGEKNKGATVYFRITT